MEPLDSLRPDPKADFEDTRWIDPADPWDDPESPSEGPASPVDPLPEHDPDDDAP